MYYHGPTEPVFVIDGIFLLKDFLPPTPPLKSVCLILGPVYGPNDPSHLVIYPSYGSYSIVFIFAQFLILHISNFAHFLGEGSKILKWENPNICMWQTEV